ncbi:MAG TPA: hypothetical protein VI461_14235, partial [Chitinophagaceae bacterium]|nr:hypothetical protein [Chitinophagaceae bacterium]
ARSSERWLERHNYAPKNFDKALIDFFRYKLPNLHSGKEEKNALGNLLTHLKKDQKTDYSILKKEFDLISWLESRIHGRPMLEVVREKKKDNGQ